MTFSGPPKVIVLGIDGLEYSLVEKWRLKNLKQKKYCKLDLSEYKVIVTPPIWSSMLLGKIDEELMDIWVRNSELLGGVGQVKEIYPSSIIYVISDHGMEKIRPNLSWGDHSRYAFFSSNTGETIDKPYQLHDLFLKHGNPRK